MANIAKPLEAPIQSSTELVDDEDKNAKEMKQSSNFFFILLAVLPCGATCSKRFINFLKDPLKVYTCFLLLTCLWYTYVVHWDAHGYSIGVVWEDLIGYNSCILEAYGLISVFRKIQNDRSVVGISGNSLIMFAISYVLRQCEAVLITFSGAYRLTQRALVLETVQFASIPLVFSLLWLVFKKYKDTYQESLDKLKIQYLLPTCVALALALTPRFRHTMLYNYCWAVSFYVDVLALLPQVVMMFFTPGKKVAVPIANFVAATAVSRVVDLQFWYLHFDVGPQGWWGDFNYTGWIIVVFHLVSLALVADFMYYYIRAKCSAYQGEDKQAVINEARGVFAI